MNQEFQCLSLPSSVTHPFGRIPTNSEQDRIAGIRYRNDDSNSDYASPGGVCGYSKPFLFLDMIWNLIFVLVSVFVILATIQERPTAPLRLWIGGYAIQCIIHMGFVWAEYRRRNLVDDDDFAGFHDFHFHAVFSLSSLCHNRVVGKLESINTILSSIWWVFGFYWIIMDGQTLLRDSPRLYWLSVMFLAFDVFFMIFCIVVTFVIFFMLFCCFPILATLTYAMTIGEGASENDIKSLPKYTYKQNMDVEKFEKRAPRLPGDINTRAELVLPLEDSECCICLYKYKEGVELCTLPCSHHFHHKCIVKWLRINATCPLCKFNILGGDMLV